MSYQIITEVHLVPSGNPKEDAKHVQCYPSGDKAYLSKKSIVIELPKGLQFNHAEGVAEELLEKGFYTSFAIISTKTK